MDYLWSPWRYNYLFQGPAPACVFCALQAEPDDAVSHIVHRARLNFVILNIFPYTSGHLMVVPYEHIATLEGAKEETAIEMFLLTRLAEHHLRRIYKPEGVNIGMNIGACAGAGVAGHIHMHVVPRWGGDSNFMTTIGETRVLPEDLAITYRKLREAFAGTFSGTGSE